MRTLSHYGELERRPFVLLLMAAVLLAAPSQISPMLISSMTMATTITTTTATTATPVTMTMPPSHDQPAGCHEHTGTVPVPQPASYKCCQTGHDSAMLQELPGVQPSLLSRAIESDQLLTVLARLEFSPPLLTPSDTSPGLVPLRV